MNVTIRDPQEKVFTFKDLVGGDKFIKDCPSVPGQIREVFIKAPTKNIGELYEAHGFATSLTTGETTQWANSYGIVPLVNVELAAEVLRG